MKTLNQLIKIYLSYCKYQKRLSKKSIKAYSIDLKQLNNTFIFYSDINKIEITSFFINLHKIYKPSTVRRKIASIRAFFNYLEYEEFILTNPLNKLNIKFQIPKLLPKTIPLNLIETILNITYHDLKIANTKYTKIIALRNIAIIELLFATGLRVSELCSIKKNCIDLENGTINIIGKGSKERILQIGNIDVLLILKKYRNENKINIKKAKYFFVNRLSSRLSEQSVRFMIKRIAMKAKIKNNITPHMFRHSFATQLLEEDVDIRYIQQMLGHSSILTTQIYTHVTQEKQRQILVLKHPRNKIKINI